MFTAEFFQFSKKRNSTKQPTSGSGTTYSNLELKDDCSILNPIIKLRVAGMPLPTVAPVNTFTYCYIGKFNRYYFIDDWVYTTGMWEAHLSIDVLASHKTEIGATSAYVERSASNYDGSIIDNVYPANTKYSVSYASLTFSYLNVRPEDGTYVVGIINAVANTAGAVTYYAMNQTQLQSLLSYMFGNDIWNTSGITEVSQGLFKSMFNPIQYIVSCMWFPFPVSTFSVGSNVTVYLGYYNTGVSSKLITTIAHKGYITGTIPSHPQASSRGDYLNYGPYTDVTIYVPPFGSIPIDTAFLKLGHYLYCPYFVDHITGEITIRVSVCTYESSTENNICAERSSKIGVNIQLSQVMADYSHSIQTLQSGLSGGVVGAVMGAIGATVQSALDSKFPSVSSSGSNGSYMVSLLQGTIVAKFTQIVDGDNADIGRPLMQVKTINTLSGFIKCGEAHFASPCFTSERDQVEQFMISGFFYE